MLPHCLSDFRAKFTLLLVFGIAGMVFCNYTLYSRLNWLRSREVGILKTGSNRQIEIDPQALECAVILSAWRERNCTQAQSVAKLLKMQGFSIQVLFQSGNGLMWQNDWHPAHCMRAGPLEDRQFTRSRLTAASLPWNGNAIHQICDGMVADGTKSDCMRRHQ